MTRILCTVNVLIKKTDRFLQENVINNINKNFHHLFRDNAIAAVNCSNSFTGFYR